MKYLCLIHLDEKAMDAMPAAEMNALKAEHLDYDDALRKSGHFIVAEALEPAAPRPVSASGTESRPSPTVPSPRRRNSWPDSS